MQFNNTYPIKKFKKKHQIALVVWLLIEQIAAFLDGKQDWLAGEALWDIFPDFLLIGNSGNMEDIFV